MSDTYDLLTLAEGKRAVKIQPNSTDKDTQLAMYITGVSRAMDDTFGPSVNRTITGELHDGGQPVIFPRKWPVSSVTSVVEYDQTTAGTLTAESVTSQPTDSYLLDQNGISIRRRNAGTDTDPTATQGLAERRRISEGRDSSRRSCVESVHTAPD